ncbi:hypothetical protein FRC20_005060 [Serendipita sp. 405]|nr:hypothetical protein FRC20_005060 [Serendipita sp. 405]
MNHTSLSTTPTHMATWSNRQDRYLEDTHSRASAIALQPRLPVEIFILIISQIHSSKDLSRLIAVSRLFRAITEPEIYRDMRINTPSIDPRRIAVSTNKRLNAMFRSLRDPHLGSHIIVFRIRLDHHWHCPVVAVPRADTLPGWCCVELDVELGGVVTNLPNLQTLSFYCQLKHTSYIPMHTWLTNVKSAHFCELEMDCGYHKWQIADLHLLRAPCFSTLQALNLDTGPPDHRPSEEFLLLLEEKNQFLPAIDTLAYNDVALGTWIVSNRPIKKIVGINNEGPTSLPDHLTKTLIKNGRKKLDLLYGWDIQYWLPEQNPTPYLNLTSLGSITVTQDLLETNILQFTEVLSFLKCLKWIEFAFSSSSYLPDFWSDQLFLRLDMQHPLLTKIYLVVRIPYIQGATSPAFLYENTEVGWRKRSARFLSYWEVATGPGC